MRSALGLVALILAFTVLPGCGGKSKDLTSDSDYKEAYEKEVRKNKELTSKYIKSLADQLTDHDSVFTSHTLLHQLLRFEVEFDKASTTLVGHLKEYRSNLSTNVREALEEQKRQIKRDLEAVLKIIGETEQKLSTEVLKKLNKDADAKVIEDPEKWKRTYKDAAKLAERLQGERDVYLLLVEDFDHMVGIRLAEIAGTTAPARTASPAPARTTTAPVRRPSPVVSGPSSGGRVIGIAQDSQTGAPISGAEVGFKWERRSSDYFARATTDSRGRYESPYLLEGRYYVDIKKEGRAVSQDREVQVTLGQEVQSSFILTEPIADGKLRIAMSWCNQHVRGAVKDVDSYLSIPGVAQPLYFGRKFRLYEGTHLDIDDTDWEGPETTTIHEIRSGTYTFYVDNYNNRGMRDALGKSEIHVEVYKGNEKIRDYRVPPGIGLTYEVFRIEKNGTITDVERYNDSLPTAHTGVR